MSLLRERPKLVGALAVLALFVAGAAYQALLGSRTSVGLHVEGNRLVDRGHDVRLLGVDWSGTELACAEGTGFVGGRTDRAAIRAMARWGINTVRIPLNEDCWLAPDGPTTGAPYRRAIESFVERLHAAGLYVILDLRRGEQPMADRARSPRFWREVAEVFKDDRRLLFDLYDEPHDVDWFCWRDGCRTQAGRLRVTGMQQLIDAVREAGAKQPLMLAGLDRGNDLGRWLDLPPFDPESQLVGAFHVDHRSRCATERCWDETVAPVARRVPVVTAELGERGCRTAFVERFARWADAHAVSYLGTTWKPGSCAASSLLEDYTGRPTRYGAALKRHLAKQDVRMAAD
jgi:hypothetical protein